LHKQQATILNSIWNVYLYIVSKLNNKSIYQ